MPLTRSAGICSVVHISLQMRNSSSLAPHDPRYASIGMLSQPAAFPLRRASTERVGQLVLKSPPAPPCPRGSDFRQTRAAWTLIRGTSSILPVGVSSTRSSFRRHPWMDWCCWIGPCWRVCVSVSHFAHVADRLGAFYVMPPSHRRRGATTVFGKNRHHRSDTASSFS